MPEKVFVVVGVYAGIVDDVTVCRHRKRAVRVAERYNVKYGARESHLYEEIIDEKEE